MNMPRFPSDTPVTRLTHPKQPSSKIGEIHDFPGKNPGVGCHFLLQGTLPEPRIKPTSPALAGRFFTAEAAGKPHQSLPDTILITQPGVCPLQLRDQNFGG